MNVLFKIIISLILILISYIFYKDVIVYEGTQRIYYYKYYIISLLLLITFLIVIRLNVNIKIYFLIIFFSFLFSFYSLEIYLTFIPDVKKSFEQKKIQDTYFQNTGKKWDTRDRFEIFEDYKLKHKNVQVTIGANSFINDNNLNILPLSGKPNVLTINCNENGYYSSYISDRYGFNNPNDEWNKKEIDFLLLGDSYTHGACVNNGIAESLRALSKKNVINLGYHGNGPLVEYATLREYHPPNFKNVILFYFENNDIYELSTELNNKIIKKYFIDENFTQKLKSKQKEINIILDNKLLSEYNKIRKNSSDFTSDTKNKFIKIIKLFKTRSLLKNLTVAALFNEQNYLYEFSKSIDKIYAFTKTQNSNFYFVYLPAFNRYSEREFKSSYLEVKKIVETKNIPFIDIHREIFFKHKNPKKLFAYSIENHYSEETYFKIADLLNRFIKYD